MENKQKNAYDAAFKFKAVDKAFKEGNRVASCTLGISESMVICWRCQNEAFRGNKCPKLEDVLEDWLNTERERTDKVFPSCLNVKVLLH